ncbi:hypothetical protein ILUMI_13218 [Ignelater luminosus]|uniref:Odorant receptor n=1 Tax=Ignelater luminosus TaxID=2038154 RepID=A0A8K0CSP1_IGNLU|nr:hypothetical protein ILUMI_13218 [Ignelater luminosus]
MTKSTNSDAFEIQKRIMTMTGFWPHRSPTIFYRIYGVIHYGMVASFALSLLISNAVVKDFSQLIQSWSMFVAILNCSIKFTIFYFKMPAFLDLLDFLHSPHFTYYEEEYDVYLARIIRFARVLVKLFLCSGVTTVILILIAPLLNTVRERQTPLPFPLDLKKQPFYIYIAVYVFQCFALFSAAWTSIGFDNLSTSMMGLSASYSKILRETIVKITDLQVLLRNNELRNILLLYGVSDCRINKMFCKCVEHHLAIIEFTEAIEDIFTYVFLSQFICSAAGICLVGFTFMNAAPGSLDFIFALSFLGTLMFQISLYCTFGNEVTVQSSRIGDACYDTEWVYCGPVVRKTMFLIMERSKRPLILTAGKFVDLSLSSLVAVVKSAASYAAVLFQVMNK